jgi:phosphonate transport system permease protein
MSVPRPPADWRVRALLAALAALVVASFVSLDLQWRAFFSAEALGSMARFVAEFFPPAHDPVFVAKVVRGAGETLAIS